MTLAGSRATPNLAVTAWLVYLIGPVAFTGVQLTAPTLPVMQTDLGLSNTQLALVSSVYLLPAALFALPAGFLADRWGRKRVLGTSLLVFGACGAAYGIVASSFGLFLVVRFVQGLAFAAILPLTITILGDNFRGSELVRAQGFRTVALGIGEAAFPIIGGFLASVAWQYAWTLQAIAIPVGILVFVLMVDNRQVRESDGSRIGSGLVVMLRSPAILALQWIGVQRMFVKFALLSFLPVYLVGTRGFSPEFAGTVIGSAAATGVVVAAFAARITKRGSLSGWLGLSLAVVALTVVAYVVVTEPWLIIVFALLHGAADGITGILSNSLVAVASTGDIRASFVAATGALRNFAKFLAPTMFGAMVLIAPLSTSFIAVGALAGAGSAIARWLKPLEGRLYATSHGRS